MTTGVQKALAYMDSHRHREAMAELAQVLAAEPENGYARGLLAQCLVQLGRLDEGTKECKRAIQSEPENPYLHYMLSRIYLRTRRAKLAEASAHEALRLDPTNSRVHGLLALSLAAQTKWKESLEVAVQGLAFDPHETNCLNARTQALSVLGRRDEAGSSIQEALQQNSEEAVTLAHSGWAMLRSGQVKPAIDYFREGLRLDPQSKACRKGMVEALRARFIAYRLLIGINTWLLRQPIALRSGLVIGAIALTQLSSYVSEQAPHYKPFLAPFIALYLGFMLMTWVGGPILNVTLLASPLGRIALTREERSEAIALAILLVISIIAFGSGEIFTRTWASIGGGLGFMGALIVCLLNVLGRRKSTSFLIRGTAYFFAAIAVTCCVLAVFFNTPVQAG